jgi:CTP synthase (UTP-ammonia lyase)
MANLRVFISFDFDNNLTEKNLFVGQAKNSRTPFNIDDWSSKESLPQKEWEDLIKSKINKCNMLIVLVGKETYTATGVVKEISFAKTQNVPVLGVYVGGADSTTTLPAGLQKNNTIDWDWDNIADAIDQVVEEGKNK